MAAFMRISPSTIRHRIDATYYHPKYVFNELRLKRSSIPTRELSDLVEKGRRAIYFQTSTLDKDEAPADWVPFLTSDDLGADGIFIDVDARRRVSPLFANNYPNGLLRSNEILVKVKGPNQTTAYVEDVPNNKVLVSGTIWGGIVRKNKVDPWYLVTALSSDYGAIARTRLRTNLNVEFLSPDDLSRMEILLPDRSVQTYIGDKVRQAARLRQRSREMERDVFTFHHSLIPSQLGLDFGRKSRKTPHGILSDRIDAHFYPAVVEDYLRSFRLKVQSLHNLVDIVANGTTMEVSEDRANSVQQVTVANLSSTFLKGEPRLVVPPSKMEKLTITHDLLLCNAAHTKSYIGREITYCHSEDNYLPSTEVMFIRLNRKKVPASYVRCYLLTKIGFIQIQSTIRGITAHSYPDDILSLRIPIPSLSDDAMAEWFSQDNKMDSAGLCNSHSVRLIAAAKLLVEALIEGQVAESDLITAQKALEVGDRKADREILGRLTRKGIDAAEELPLFPNLDVLYQALDTPNREG